MTVRLNVQRAAWSDHVTATAQAYGPALVPVIKGNGYGLGGPLLHSLARELLGPITHVCVGSIYEVDDVPADVLPVVLTPTLAPAAIGRAAILTVGNTEHVDALRASDGDVDDVSVMVKLASSMRRFGATVDEFPSLMRAVENLELNVAGYALHLPLAGTDETRLAEIETWLPFLPFDVPLWLSHLEPATVHVLQAKYPLRKFKVRVGTALWHGIPKVPDLQLQAEVLHAQPIGVGEIAGYHHTRAPFDGTLVVVAAGSTHGIAANETPSKQPLSPFHFARTRMALLEPPHMHTSLVVVAADATAPKIGEWVDVQRPLINTRVDHVEWT